MGVYENRGERSTAVADDKQVIRVYNVGKVGGNGRVCGAWQTDR